MGVLAERFTRALQQLEQSRDVEAVIGLFAEDASLWRAPRDGVYQGREGARKFWAEYLDAFSNIGTQFRKVTEAGDTAVLEWSSSAQTSHGAAIEYDGCTVLEGDEQGIHNFRTYYDAASAGTGAATTSAQPEPAPTGEAEASHDASQPGDGAPQEPVPDPATETVMEPTQEAG